MRIGIDAKRIFHNATGLGNGNRTLIQMLIDHHPEHDYVLFTNGIKINPHIRGNSEVFKYTGAFKGLWRSRGIAKDLIKKQIDLFVGPSNEIPFTLKNIDMPSIVLMHDIIFKRYPNQYPLFDRVVYNFKSKYACKNASHIVAASETTKQDIIEYYNISPDRISVIYQSCDASYFQNLNRFQIQTVKDKYALPEKFILNVGSVIERKNLLNVCKAFLLIPEADRIPVVVIGKGKAYEKQVKDFIRINNLEQWFVFLTNVPNADLPPIYHLAECTIYPSYCEGFGIPVLESMVCGVPVITSNISSMPEVAGDAAVYFDPYDAKSIADAIMQVHNDPDLRNTMIEKGRRQVKKFTGTDLADQWNTVFRKVNSEQQRISA
ncbi:MAG: glycosyltransferase family 4 protein [Bacteroidetes bacterium]|nr:glycosyltransferase family 4 protein [Bacteroidota bacterium]